MTSNDPSYPEMLTFLVLFISPEDSFMDSGTVQQCVPGVWLGQVHKCAFLQGPPWGLMLGEASRLPESPPTWGRSWVLLGHL